MNQNLPKIVDGVLQHGKNAEEIHIDQCPKVDFRRHRGEVARIRAEWEKQEQQRREEEERLRLVENECDEIGRIFEEMARWSFEILNQEEEE
jgi:hypothetical protein